MPRVILFFAMHQPFRLHPETERFEWEEKDAEVFRARAQRCYLPALEMLTAQVRHYPHYRVSLGISGTFLKQAELYETRVVVALRDLLEAGRERGQVEFLEETFFHSLAGLYADPRKREFKDQVSMHRGKMRDLFGYRPGAFANTELIYNTEIANTVADMGFRVQLCSGREDMYDPATGETMDPHRVYRAKGRRGRARELLVVGLDWALSGELAGRFKAARVNAKQYAERVSRTGGEVALIGYNFEQLSSAPWSDAGVMDFWRALPGHFAEAGVAMTTPGALAEEYRERECPVVDLPEHPSGGWAAMQRHTLGWISCDAQYDLFRDVEMLEADARAAGGTLFQKWRVLTSCDHLYYLREGHGANHSVGEYENPYGSLTRATFVLTRAVDNFGLAVKTFHIRKRTPVTPVVLISPETGRLPTEGLGSFAQYVSGKSGGLGEVVSALCKGFGERKIEAHLITLNLRRRFQEESRLSEEEWIQSRHKLDPEHVHLVTSSIFEDYRSAYDGDPVETAAEFQRQCINTYIKVVRSKHDGRALLHTHDWMAGGAIAAYAKLRQIPVLHSVHNTHTAAIPVEALHGINVRRLWSDLVVVNACGVECVDAQATAIRSATKINYVGKRFLQEVINDYFLDRPIIPPSVRQETKLVAKQGRALVIYNGISPDVYPERQEEDESWEAPGLAQRIRVESKVVEAKRANRVKFQRQMGLDVDPEAILLYWPSRLDPLQKGVDLLEMVAQRFVEAHEDVQIAVVGNPVGNDRHHAEVMGRIAVASKGRIAYAPFQESLSVLGYAAASDVFGASLYEPFGQIDVVGNLYGATATNRDTGGYSDKIIPLALRVWGAPQDQGNGVLFKTYDPQGLWWGLHQAVENHRFFRSDPYEHERQVKRIMREARRNWSLENMVAGYITAYEQLNNGRPLV